MQIQRFIILFGFHANYADRRTLIAIHIQFKVQRNALTNPFALEYQFFSLYFYGQCVLLMTIRILI